MNLAETRTLLAVLQRLDGRKPDDATVLVWQPLLADVTLAEARASVEHHFATSTDYLMPAHVLRGVMRYQAEQHRATLDAAHDAKLHALDSAPRRDRSADVLELARSIAAPRGHNLTLRRRDMAGLSWAWACTCGLNPMGQDHPSKDAARAAGLAHAPQEALTHA